MSNQENSTKTRIHTISVGDQFNRFTVIGPVVEKHTPQEKRPNHKTRCVPCRCECGTEKLVSFSELTGGGTKSCGCLRSQRSSERASERNLKHGFYVNGKMAPEYNIWRGIQKRCHNPSDKDYPRYGGRGIAVCDRWRSSFESFLEDMGRRPSPKHQIERVDNDGPYAPENCRWATAKEQAENRRSTIHLEHEGNRLSVSEWSRITGIGVTTIFYRIKSGWSVADTLTTPNDAYHTGKLRVPRSNNRIIEHDGKRMSLSEWSRHIGVTRGALLARLKRGWPLEKALRPS